VLSLSYNLGVTLFGGFAAAIFTWLATATHDNAAPPTLLANKSLDVYWGGISHRHKLKLSGVSLHLC
jgi:hypothetical protein